MTPFPSFFILAIATVSLGGILSWGARRWDGGDGAGIGVGRKVFHAGTFTGAVPAQLWLGFWGVVLYGTILSTLVLVAWRRRPSSGLYRVLARRSDGDRMSRPVLRPLVATALGGLVSVLLVGPFAVVGYLVCGWGDAAGEVVGGRWGRRRYRPLFLPAGSPARTLEGSMAVLAAGFLGGWAALDLLGFGLGPAVGVGFLSGLAGAVTEGVSGPGTDNLWMQPAASLVAWWFLG